MARLVLDTNSLIQCIAHRSRYHAIWLSLLDGRNRLCVSNEILEEYEEMKQRMQEMEAELAALKDALAALSKDAAAGAALSRKESMGE